MVVRSCIGIGLQRVGGRRGVAKVSRKWCNLDCAGSESRTVGGAQRVVGHLASNRHEEQWIGLNRPTTARQ